MVYHPGRVLKVFPAQGKAGEAAATIRFWDNNLHTVKASSSIAGKLKEGIMVLVDYYPMSERLNRPRMVATCIVDSKDEKELWDHYKGFLRMKRKAVQAARKNAAVPQPRPGHQVGVG